jgi:hypothetical protein
MPMPMTDAEKSIIILECMELVTACPHRGGWITARPGCDNPRRCRLGKGSLGPGQASRRDCMICKFPDVEGGDAILEEYGLK